MSEKDNGGAAFPLSRESSFGKNYEGMTLRDYMAAKAMQANLAVIREFPDEHWRDGLAIYAYMMADAMLRARGN